MSINLNRTTTDLDVLIMGDRFPVTAGPNLRNSKWRAGLWVRYVEDESTSVSFTVEQSNGRECIGFLLFESEEYADARQSTYRNYTSYQNTSALASANGTAVLTLVTGGGRFLFKNFETIALDAFGVRQGGAITYNLNEPLKISENGLLCNDPDARLSLAIGGDPIVVGICSKKPDLDGKLGFDLKY